MTAAPNLMAFPPDPGEEGKTYIHVSAINRGNSATTVTHFLGYSSNNLWDLIRSKKQHFIVHGASGSSPIPHKIHPGDEWRGVADQDIMKEHFTGKYLYLGIVHNQRKKPIFRRVKYSA